MIAETPAPPYWAVLFTSLRTEGDNGYGAMSEAMERLAQRQPGFLGIESARDGLGITISDWRDLDSIAAWKGDVRHLAAQEKGGRTGTNAARSASRGSSGTTGSGAEILPPGGEEIVDPPLTPAAGGLVSPRSPGCPAVRD